MTTLVGTFDFIIVGAGSGGCVLADRLSASGEHRVLLLEAGGRDDNFWIHVPLGYGRLFNHPTLNWRYKTDPEPHLGGREIAQPRGRVLGGSSSINGLIYIRGQHEDFDGWRDGGCPGWGFDDLLPYFRRSEDQVRGSDCWHGVGGPLAVSDQSETHPLCDAFIAAAGEAGHPINEDFNGAAQEGAGYYQTTSRKGRRWSTAVAYLRRAQRRTNLTVVTNALVHRVTFDNKRATGVTWSGPEGLARATARREIVMTAGAIGTPAILQRSGLGPAARVRALGVELVHDLPELGENMQDHFQVRSVYRSTRKITLNDDLASWWRTAWIGARYLATRKGPLTVSAGYAGGFFKSQPGVARPDIQVHFITFSTNKMGDRLDPFSGFTASTCQLRPTSRGHVRAISPDPTAAPSILANYLATEEDCEVNLNGIAMLQRIMDQPAIAPFVDGTLAPPRDAFADRAAMLDYARATGGSLYHPSCTARMGSDAGAVTAPDLLVNGIEGLSVVDASVMPSVVSGNTNAVIVAIAEKGADLILARSGQITSG